VSKKKGESPTTIKTPRMISVRDFVRGGYQHVEEPMLVMSQSHVLFAAYPVETSPDYLQTQLAPDQISRADPAWLTRGVSRIFSPSPSSMASAQPIAPRAPRAATKRPARGAKPPITTGSQPEDDPSPKSNSGPE